VAEKTYFTVPLNSIYGILGGGVGQKRHMGEEGI